MDIRFSKQELEQMRQLFDQINSGEIGALAAGSPPAWPTTFLLLRKLLAYGFHCVRQGGSTSRYQELQRLTTKPDGMLTAVRQHLSEFEQLLATYVAQQAAT